MSEINKERKASQPSSTGRSDANALISARLRGYYDSIVEEGTPDHLLTLLEKLADAEREQQNKKS